MTPISVALVFETPDHARVERRHLQVLCAVADAGSLTGASRRLGLSYRGVCNAVERLNELFGVPLVEGVVGGAGGGGARLTPAGDVFLRCCERLGGQLRVMAADLHKEVVGASRDAVPAFASAEPATLR